MMLKPDETKSSICDIQVSFHSNGTFKKKKKVQLSDWSCVFFFVQMADGPGLGESGSVLDFMSLKNYPDMSLDMSMLNSLGDYPHPNSHRLCLPQ